MRREEGLVSVIMPVYNGEAYVATAIESVLQQSYPRWELVVVDDGSSDRTAEIVGEFDDERLRYTYQENQGQTAALNKGLELARGEYVTTLDADDAFTVESLRERVFYLETHSEDGVVYGDGFYCDESGEPFLRFSEQMPTGVSGDVYGDVIVSPFFGTGASVMIRQQVLEDWGIRYDESIVWCQDWDFYIRLAERTPFGFVDAPTVLYRVHQAGMTVVMPEGRRLDSLIRMRWKVMEGVRFGRVSESQRAQFFYDFLVEELQGRPDVQSAVFASAPFRDLSRAQQSRLLRLTAVPYLLTGEHVETAKRWLMVAWRGAPFDLKTSVVAGLATVHVALARRVISLWHSSRSQSRLESPFEPITAPE